MRSMCGILSFLGMWLWFLMNSSVSASETTAAKSEEFQPGIESRIDIADKCVGGGFYMLYVPTDYTPDQNWPVIFVYHGAGEKPSPASFKIAAEGKGFIIVAMEFVTDDLKGATQDKFIAYLEKEIASISAVKQHLAQSLKIDEKRLFLAGISKGGWRVSAIAERNAKDWAGFAITLSGRVGLETPHRSELGGKPIYIGSGETDPNLPHAKMAAAYYQQLGSKVTFDLYKGLGHEFNGKSKILHDWLIAIRASE